MPPEIIRIEQTSSTQDEARSLWSAERVALGDVIVADVQTSGRGRFGRSWVSPTGGLYATFLAVPEALLPLRAGLAVSCAVEPLGVDTRLKWPNDVLVNGRKLAGMLVEQTQGAAFVGFGVNVTHAPIEDATCVHHWNPTPLLDDLLLAIRSQLQHWVNAPESEVLQAYRSRCSTLGSRVRLERSGVPPIEGVALDIDAAGCLRIECAAEEISVCSGDCLHLRPA